MLTDIKKRELKSITVKVEKNIAIRFKELCKENKVTQVAIIEKAMLIAIREWENKNNEK